MLKNNVDFAVIGMACRFPGAGNYQEFWQNLVQGKNCISQIPEDRWNWQDYYGDPKTETNKTNIKWGGFIEDIDKFDPMFFNISPKEAACMDPQHRLFLQTAWHAMEDAGYDAEQLSGSYTGIYAGVSKNDYSELMRETHQDIAPFISTGTVHSILSNRLSFLFDFHGRSESVDTACSSGLVALHNAMRDIVNAECEQAIVGGVNALLAPTMFISHSKSGMLSSDGQCKTFDANANGYVRGEGVGVLMIKPLNKAIVAGDHIHAVIKSSAVNHGGRANFLTSPTVAAQSEVIKAALDKADIAPTTISYIEAHGTGTPMGDPIEINALKKAFNSRQDQLVLNSGMPYCALSSVKTNIGHLESASGIAGIIKAILAMQHQQIPALRNFNTLNPYIELKDSPFYIADKNIKWNCLQYTNGEAVPRRVGVSSFGMGGVNAHVILQEAPPINQKSPAMAVNKPQIILVSAKKNRLKIQAEQLRDYLLNVNDNASSQPAELTDIAYTLQTGRRQFSERLALIVSSREELVRKLDDYIAGMTNNQDCYTASVVSKKGEKPDLLIADKNMDLALLADKWVHGTKLDWSAYYDDENRPSKVPLPTYAFTKKRCWFDQQHAPSGSKAVLPAQTGSSLHINLPENGFNKLLQPNDFFIKDHVVQGQKLLPGVAYLEFVRAAYCEQAGQPKVNIIRNTFWISPVMVNDDNVNITIKFDAASKESGDDYAYMPFEISQNDKLHSKGELGTAELNTSDYKVVNLEDINDKCADHMQKQALYQLFDDNGLSYGPGFQAIQHCQFNDSEIVSELLIPAVVRDDFDNYVLHPSIMDGVFQTIVALTLLGLKQLENQYVPYSLDRLEIIKPVTERCFAHAVVSKDNPQNQQQIKFNAVLCDEKGNTLVKITGLSKRALFLASSNDKAPVQINRNDEHKTTDGLAELFYTPVWHKQELPQTVENIEQLIVFGNNHTIVDQINASNFVIGPVILIVPGERFTMLNHHHLAINPGNAEDYLALIQYFKDRNISINHILYLWHFTLNNQPSTLPAVNSLDCILRLTKAIIAKRAYKKLTLLYLYSLEQQQLTPYHSMVAGFARTLIYESPNMRYTTVGVDTASPEQAIDIAIKEFKQQSSNKLHEVYYRDGIRHERKVVGFNRLAELSKKSPALLRKNGVYLISGGAGGLGFIFAKYLAETYSATVLMLGRSELNDQISGKIKVVESLGGRCRYFRADITKQDELQQAISDISESYPSIQGVIHAAGIIEDAYILLKKEASFDRVIKTKVQGLVNLDALTCNQKLDFFMMFSSIASLMPNQGQCDYAAANSFLDNFSVYRNSLSKQQQRSGVSLAINWPLWAQGGMQLTAEEQAHLLKEFGMKPLDEAKGLIIFEQALKLAGRFSLSEDLSQIVAIDGDKQKIADCLGIEDLTEDAANSGEVSVIKQLAAKINQLHVERPVMQGVNKNIIESDIKQIFADHFDLAADKIDISLNISELGLDSASVLLIIRQINKQYQLDLKPTLFFEINTIDQLIQHIYQDSKIHIKSDQPRHNQSLIDVSLSDLSKMHFERVFKTSEFYLKDHVVEQQYNMPGACYIEMARQAGELVWGEKSVIKLTNNYWVSKLSSPDQDFSAYLNIIAKHSDYQYEIYSYGGSQKHKLENKIIHAIGHLICVENEQRTNDLAYCDLSAIRSRCQLIQYPDQIYKQIIAEGLHVGPTFMPMQQILLNGNEALASLKLPETIQHTVDDYILHPTMLTGVFQTALISNRLDNSSDDHYIPISIDEIEIVAPVSGQCFIYSTAYENKVNIRKFDLLVCREDGQVAVKLTGFTIRALKNTKPDKTVQPAPESETVVVSETINHDALNHASLQAATQHYIKSLLSEPLGLAVNEIDDEEPFEVYGINSVMIVELNKAFEDVYGALSKTLFFEYRNVAELAGYFIDNHAEKCQKLTGSPKKNYTQPSTGEQSASNTLDLQPHSEQIIEPVPSASAQPSNHDRLETATQHYIKNLLSDPIGLSVDEIDADEAFDVYGINSVMIVELNKAFEDVFGPLSKTLFFEYRNVVEMAQYFIENHAEQITRLVGLQANDVTQLTSDNAVQANEHQQDDANTVLDSTDRSENRPVEPVEPVKDGSPVIAGSEDNDIAIIGVDGRYPGANNVEQLWTVLKQGRDCVTEIPPSHFDYTDVYNADPEQNKIYANQGGFIEDADKFDAAFFNISPREAELIDPQERLFLQVTWGMLEDAGYTRQALLDASDRQVGVFVGALWQPYQALGTEETVKGNVVAPSGLLYSIANRVSYYLNLSGPSLAIDTACSSSLSAVHLACQSIRNGDCNMAIAGGVNLSLHSSKYLFLSQNRFLSTDGRCRSFGAGGDGYVPGEGVGAVLLKSLSAAKKDGDRIYAVIKGSAINHGGKTHGYTVPSPNAQADLIKQAHKKADIDPRTISYIEAHGTGTSLGDPIEMTGLDKAFSSQTQDKQFCAIGSIKSNIGHLEAAAGIASITKVILQMKNSMLVPSIHSDRLNPNINFEKTSFKVQRELSDWQQPVVNVDGVTKSFARRAGISSFGAGGANAHIILEEYQDQHADEKSTPTMDGKPAMIVLTAMNDQRLTELTQNLQDHLQVNADTVSLINLAYTLQTGREMMDERLGVIVNSMDELQDKLQAYLNKDKNINDLYAGNVNRNKDAWSGLKDDEDMIQIIDLMIGKGKYNKLLELWTQGFNIDWTALYGQNKPEKISLPTYPFAKDRYWIPENQQQKAVALHKQTSVLHPLVHENTSSLAQQRFNSLFTGDEFFLRDHVVGENKVLPAVAYIEMLRAACSFSSDQLQPAKLYNLTWLKPIMVDQQPEKITVELSVEDDDVFLQVGRDSNGTLLAHAQGQVHYVDANELENRSSNGYSMDVNELEQGLEHHAQSSSVYQLFHQKGLNLQQSFQGINWVKWNDHEALGQISLPEFLYEHDRNAYDVHPCLLDSALQVALFVLERDHQKAGALYLPYSIGEVEFFSALPDTLYSSVTASDSKAIADSGSAVRSFDVVLLNASGDILLNVKNISFRETDLSEGTINSSQGLEAVTQLAQTEGSEPDSIVNYSTPSWIASPLADNKQSEFSQHSLILFSNNEQKLSDFSTAVSEQYQGVCVVEVVVVDDYPKPAPGRIYISSQDEEGYQQFVDYLKQNTITIDQIVCLWDSAIAKDTESIAGQTGDALSQLFYLNKFVLQPDKSTRQLFVNLVSEDMADRVMEGGIAGLLNSLSREYPKLSSKVVSIPVSPSLQYAWVQHIINELLDNTRDNCAWIRYQSAEKETVNTRYKWQLQTSEELEISQAVNQNSVFKQGGTYLISGGMGGIAKVLGNYLVTNYHVNLIILGRSVLNQTHESYLDGLRAKGGGAVYIQTDISDLTGLEEKINHVKKDYGNIEGVMHCAGVLEDSLLANKQHQSFVNVLQPKLQGTYNLDQVTKSDLLDFFVVFSSLTSILGNPGQSDYGAANGFMDAYINDRADRVRQHQRSGLSLAINWPFWKEGEMGQDADVLSLLDESFGLALDNAEGIHCFEQVLQLEKNQVAIIKQTEEVISAAGEAENTMHIHHADLEQSSPVLTSTHDSQSDTQPDQTTLDLDSLLNNEIKTIIAELGKFKLEQILPQADFISLGLDSVILAKLASRLNKRYSLKISPAIFFEYTNMEKLTAHLLDEYDTQLNAGFQGQVPNKQSASDSINENTVMMSKADLLAQQSKTSRFSNKKHHVDVDKISDKQLSHDQVSSSDIAVIGMDCLFPGAPDLEAFWQLLAHAESAISEVPADRWDWQDYYGDPAKESNKTNIKWGGFVEDLDKFDASFFNISPREASLMDPQQRILLQSVWKGLENAGYAPLELSKTNKVGFFVGASTNDYYELLANQDVEAYSSTGGTHSITANRVSYMYDFKGPSIAVDTACSSSLIALDMAVKSLQDGRCDVAIAGGVNALITPTLYLSFSKAGMLSPNGNISPLDKQANGYVRGEGVGIVVLKKLNKAITDNDDILAVIKGTSVNHGGKVSSLTVPSPKAQSELIVEACQNADVDVTTLNYIEMHGTGTPLGDPIEVNGLKSAFKKGHAVSRDSYCGIASVKGNIGHLEAAAGIAGVIKTILALKHKKLPAQCHFKELNPHIQLEQSPFQVVDELHDWESLTDDNGHVLPRRAGVSSFGFGGANSHVVIEEFSEPKSDMAFEYGHNLTGSDKPALIILSAMTEERLTAVAGDLKDFLSGEAEGSDNLYRIAYTLQEGRTAMRERLGILVHSQQQLLQKLSAYVNGEQNIKSLYRGQVNEIYAIPTVQSDDSINVDSWINKLQYEKLIKAWVAGVHVDWNKLYPVNKPKRLALPAYPFAKERFWLSKESKKDSQKTVQAPAAEVISTTDQPANHLIETKIASEERLRDKSICYFKALAASTLQMSIEKIESTRSLEEYGMDSILVMQVVNQLHGAFPGINSTILFEYRTIDSLVDYLIETQQHKLMQLVGFNHVELDQNNLKSKTKLAFLKPNPAGLIQSKQAGDTDDPSALSISQIAAEVSSQKVDFQDALKMVKRAEVEVG